MYYKINVSLDNWHFFATSEHSITSKVQLNKVLPIFKEKFPKSEGYSISVMLLKTVGEEIEID